MTTVSRKQFQEAIDAALMPLRETIPFDAWVALRKVGATATEFSVGTYRECPLTLAGYLPTSFWGARQFAYTFDDQFEFGVDFRVEG